MRQLCRLLGYSSQAYYSHGKHLVNQGLKEDLLLQQVVIYRSKQPRLGTRKLLVKLEVFIQAHGISIGRDAFFELLRANGLLQRRRRRNKPLTTLSHHRYKKYADLVKGYIPDRPCALWVSDITYMTAGRGFAYLSLITDAYSRKIVGYHLGEGLQAEGPLAALAMAIRNEKAAQPLIHHSDRGVQYCSLGYTAMLQAGNIRISMTQSSDPRDNAIAERVNGILKQELLNGYYADIEKARQAVAEAVETYNRHRPHSSVSMLTPEQAHQCSGPLDRKWKNYYKAKEVIMSG